MEAGQFTVFLREVEHFITGPIAKMVAAILIVGTAIAATRSDMGETMKMLALLSIAIGLLLAGSAILGFLCHC